MFTGGCLCGAVRYRIHAQLPPIQVCYCGMCRKAQGTPFATNVPVPAAAFELVSGAAALREYESSPGKQRVFCGTCGSPIFSRRAGLDVLRVRAGLIEQALVEQTMPAELIHCHLDGKCSWWTIREPGPQFSEACPPANP